MPRNAGTQEEEEDNLKARKPERRRKGSASISGFMVSKFIILPAVVRYIEGRNGCVATAGLQSQEPSSPRRARPGFQSRGVAGKLSREGLSKKGAGTFCRDSQSDPDSHPRLSPVPRLASSNAPLCERLHPPPLFGRQDDTHPGGRPQNSMRLLNHRTRATAGRCHRSDLRPTRQSELPNAAGLKSPRLKAVGPGSERDEKPTPKMWAAC